MNYDEWKQQTPDQFNIESEPETEKCFDCDEESNDMRYFFDHTKMYPICPICQQERVINDLEIALSRAVKELELRKSINPTHEK